MQCLFDFTFIGSASRVQHCKAILITFKHLKSSSACREACNENCFAVLDSAGTAYKRKIKEALHIMWEGPNLNKQLNHYNISLNF